MRGVGIAGKAMNQTGYLSFPSTVAINQLLNSILWILTSLHVRRSDKPETVLPVPSPALLPRPNSRRYPPYLRLSFFEVDDGICDLVE